MALRRVPLTLTEFDLQAARADAYHYTITCENPQCRKQIKKVLREVIDNDDTACGFCGLVIDLASDQRRAEITDFVQKLAEIEVSQRGKPS